MSQLGELLNKLATQSGIDANDEGLKALLSNPTVSTYDIPDNIALGIQNGLLTVDSAKNNPTLKNHFFALALNGVDSEINNLTTEFGLDSSIIEELNAEKSSTKRAGLLVRKIKDLESAKANTNTQGKDVLQREIDKLNGELRASKDASQSEINSVKAQHKEDIKNMLIKTVLNSYDYSLPTSKDVSVSAAMSVLTQELTSRGAKVVLNDNNELALQNSEGLDFFLNNNKVSFKDLADQTLATHKLLKTKETPAPTPAPTPTPGGGNNEFFAAASQNAQQFKD